MARFLPWLALIAACSTTAAQADTLPQSLIHCDSSFFKEMKAQSKALKEVVPLVIHNQYAWIVPAKDGSETTWFSQPLKVQQLTLSGFYQSKSDLDEMGKYYFWGFIIDESPAVVAAAMPEANWQKDEEEYFASPMIKTPRDKDWTVNTTAVGGIAPAKDSMEKLAILSEHNGKSLLTCTVQGAVTDDILLSLRPDLADKK